MCESVNVHVCVYRKVASPFKMLKIAQKNTFCILPFRISEAKTSSIYTRYWYYGYNLILKLMIVGCMYEEMRSCSEFVITLECTIGTLFSSKI